ncbi:rCG28533 [Rattus norvegicus]|uniref:RCG28533 n=1 Tax=Rattus norvegicus TaxID=10116 RepID=A6HUV4_RAT|nr:rCG28533 [Rattus norvegicus]
MSVIDQTQWPSYYRPGLPQRKDLWVGWSNVQSLFPEAIRRGHWIT